MSKKYIEADELIEHIEIASNYRGYQIKHALQDVKDFPAADVRENVRGEWIYKDYKTCCSKCFSPYGVRYDGENNFCPNCGADMRGEQGG